MFFGEEVGEVACVRRRGRSNKYFSKSKILGIIVLLVVVVVKS